MLVLVDNEGLVDVAFHSFGHSNLSQGFEIFNIVIFGGVNLNFPGGPIVREGEEFLFPPE